jgi:hypothetical protein
LELFGESMLENQQNDQCKVVLCDMFCPTIDVCCLPDVPNGYNSLGIVAVAESKIKLFQNLILKIISTCEKKFYGEQRSLL